MNKDKQPKIPKSISIVGDDYPIEPLTKENLDFFDIHDADFSTALGLCNQLRGVILLRPGMGLSRTRSTLLHEIMHVIVGQSYLGLEPDKEEQLVTVVSQLLYETLKTNKSLIKFLFD